MAYEMERRAARQANVVARWQLLDDGLTRKAIAHRTRALREIHSGVWLLGAAPPTAQQLWWAAAISARERCLAFASAGAAYGFRAWSGAFETACAPGSGGPRRIGALLVSYSTVLDRHVTTLDGLPITTAARTLVDLAPHLGERQLGRAVREALRLRVTTCAEIQTTMLALGNRKSPRRLAAFAAQYARLPLAGAMSDAESYAIALIGAAGLPLPAQNAWIAGERADLSWPERRHIVEVDGPDFHLFADEDLRKQRVWEGAGWHVERVPSDDVFDHPERLLGAAFRTGFAPMGLTWS